ncbi:MAG: sulfur carrier protein ThiS [Bacteroidota bacterium]
MQVFVNDELLDGAWNTLGDVLVSNGMNETKGIAVAVNNEVVPKHKWSEFDLDEKDKILIIKAAAGG